MRRLPWLIARALAGPSRHLRGPLRRAGPSSVAPSRSMTHRCSRSETAHSGMFCTATAHLRAHAVDRGPLRRRGGELRGEQPGRCERVAGRCAACHRQAHAPKWFGGNLDYDVGLVLLDSAPAMAFKAWNRAPVSMQAVPAVPGLGLRRDARRRQRGAARGDGTGHLGLGYGPVHRQRRHCRRPASETRAGRRSTPSPTASSAWWGCTVLGLCRVHGRRRPARRLGRRLHRPMDARQGAHLTPPTAHAPQGAPRPTWTATASPTATAAPHARCPTPIPIAPRVAWPTECAPSELAACPTPTACATARAARAPSGAAATNA